MLALKRWPGVVAGYARLVRLRPDRTATALAIVRGCALGVCLVGSWSVLMAAAIHFGITWPRIPNHTGPLGSPFPALTLAAASVRAAVAIALYLLFVLTLSRRWIQRAPFLVALGAIAWLPFLSTISLEPLTHDWFTVLLTIALAAGLSWVLLSYELVTLMVCLVTFNLFRSNYGFLGMFAPIGNGQFWMLFLAWGTLLGWAAAVAFRPVWNRAGRGLADAF